DPFHLRHGYVHQHDVRTSAVVLCNSRAAISRFTRYLSAKRLNHAGQVLARENGIIHYQITDGLAVFAFYWCKLLHKQPSSYSNLELFQQSHLPVANHCFPARAAFPPLPGSCPHCACSVFAKASNATTRVAKPRSMAAL